MVSLYSEMTTGTIMPPFLAYPLFKKETKTIKCWLGIVGYELKSTETWDVCRK